MAYATLYGTWVFAGVKNTLPKTGNMAGPSLGPQPPAQSRARADVGECLSLQDSRLTRVEGSPWRNRDLSDPCVSVRWDQHSQTSLFFPKTLLVQATEIPVRDSKDISLGREQGVPCESEVTETQGKDSNSVSKSGLLYSFSPCVSAHLFVHFFYLIF